MAVTPLVNGATITAANIVAMHNAVRTEVNGLGNANVARGSFNEDHLTGLVLGGGTFSSSAEVGVDQTCDNTDPSISDVLDAAQFTTVLSGAPSASFGVGAYLYIWAWWDMSGWPAATGESYAHHMGVFALTIGVDSAPHDFPYDSTDQGILHAFGTWNTENTGDDFVASRPKIHTPGSMMSMFESASSFTFDSVRLSAGACACGGGSTMSASGGDYFTVPRAGISWLAIRK